MKTVFLLFLISFSQAFTQTMRETIETNDYVIPYFSSPEPKFYDSIERILISNKMVDSSTIIIQTPFSLDGLKRGGSKLYSAGFCFYIDAIHLDSFAVTMVERHIYRGSQRIGRESFKLKTPLFLSLEYFYYGFGQGVGFVDQPDLKLTPFYRKQEIDRHSNYRFLAIITDEENNLWVKVKFNCDCNTDDYEKRNWVDEAKEIEGWTLLNQLQIGYICSPY